MPRTRRFIPLALFLATAFADAQSVPPAGTSQQPTAPVRSPADTSQQPSAPVNSAAPLPADAAPANASSDSKADTGSDADDQHAKEKPADDDQPIKGDHVHNPVLWTNPGNIAARDLFYGQGGEKHQPKPPFTFLREDMHGSNPKFDARDADGKKWRVKLGEEARPEVVASRLLWAVGYFANDDYLLPETTVQGLKMRRKSPSAKGDQITFARFARKPGGQDKIGIWEWKDNPFTGTREFNGLRVMMAVMNNWDLKDDNNSVYRDDKNDRQIFLANDVGAAFGTNGLSWTRARSKGNIDSFKESKFITRLTDTEVDFATPAAPKALLAESVGFGAIPYVERAKLDWIGKNIPRSDARWIGSLLAQLTHKQLVDAFRAGNFPPDVIDMYVALLESRIAELKAL
jgi:hypothetical protein